MFEIDYLATHNQLKMSSKNKACLGLLLLGISFITSNVILYICVLMMSMALSLFFAKIPVKKYFALYKIPLLFIIIGVISVMVNIGRINHDYLYYFRLGSTYFGINKSGLDMGLQILLRSFSAISATFFMSTTIPLMETAKLLAKIKVHPVIIEQMILMYRFIGIFFHELSDMKNASLLKHGDRTFKTRMNTLSLIMTNLFFRVMLSYDDFRNAGDLKGFTGNFYL